MNRRNFIIKGSAGAVATMVPFSSFGLFANSKNDIINVGVIGTGSRGSGLISIMEDIPNLRLTACCDILPFRLKAALSETVNEVKGYTDYRELLDDKDVDAVIIATPFSTHSSIAVDSLQAGKHVYAEKTLAKGYKDISTLYDQAQQSPQIFQTGHQYHSSRLYTHVVDLIREGAVGNITSFDCQWNRHTDWRRNVPRPELERLINWRMYREYSGGLVAEMSSHQIDFVNWVLNATPNKVMGVGGIDYYKDGRETYDNIHLIYSYPNGIEAKFTCLTTNDFNNYRIKVMGDKGTIILDFENAWFYPQGENELEQKGIVDGVAGATVQWEEGKGIPINVHHTEPSEQALLDFASSIINNNRPKSNVLTGSKTAMAVQMALDAMYNEKVAYWNEDVLS